MPYEYDVALSFAGEDRKYVDQVANILKENDINVFYDEFEIDRLWGENLYTYLGEIYSEKAQYTVIFCSKFYSTKLWTNHERENAQARAFRENKPYILPTRFDDTKIPGVLDTVGYVDLRKTPPHKLCQLIARKLKKRSSEKIAKNIITTKKLFENKCFSEAIDLFSTEVGGSSTEDTLYYILSYMSKVKVSDLQKTEIERLYSLIDGVDEKERLAIFNYLWLIIFYEHTNRNMVSRSMESRKDFIKSRALSKKLTAYEKELFKNISPVTRQAKFLIF